MREANQAKYKGLTELLERLKVEAGAAGRSLNYWAACGLIEAVDDEWEEYLMSNRTLEDDIDIDLTLEMFTKEVGETL